MTWQVNHKPNFMINHTGTSCASLSCAYSIALKVARTLHLILVWSG